MRPGAGSTGTGRRHRRSRRAEALLATCALQSTVFNSADFSSIATDAAGVIQISNVGAERMLGYAAQDVPNRITPADISDAQEVVARAKALSVELGTSITPGFEALVFKASRGIEDIYELTARARDGTLTVVSYNAATFHDRDRRLQGVFASARDVTELSGGFTTGVPRGAGASRRASATDQRDTGSPSQAPRS